MKNKTLYEKREKNPELLHGDNRVWHEKDLKQTLKEVMKNNFNKFGSGSKDFTEGFLKGIEYMKDKIKSKFGEELLE